MAQPAPPGDHGIGHAAPFPGSTKTGTFWFFNPANVELIVKALDGSTVNGNFWVFYGGAVGRRVLGDRGGHRDRGGEDLP